MGLADSADLVAGVMGRPGRDSFGHLVDPGDSAREAAKLHIGFQIGTAHGLSEFQPMFVGGAANQLGVNADAMPVATRISAVAAARAWRAPA